RFSEPLESPDGKRVHMVEGSVPADAPPTLFPCPVREPAQFAAANLHRCLREAGVTLDDEYQVAREADLRVLLAQYTPANLLAEHISPPLSEAAKVILKVSQNLHANQLPSILGAAAGCDDAEQGGFDRERDLWARAGLDLTQAAKADGAGKFAYFSPRFMVQ